MGRGPSGASFVANILTQKKGLEPQLAPVQIAQGVLAPATQVPHGLVFEGGYVNGAQVPAAHQASQRDGIAPVRLHAVTWFSGNQRWGHDSTGEPSAGQIAIQPVAAWPGLINENERRLLRLQFTNELVDVGLARGGLT